MSGIQLKRIWLIASILLYLAGCGSEPTRRQAPPPDAGQMAQADQLESHGDYINAANLLQRLAMGQDSPNREMLRLRAADDLLRGGLTDSAERLLGGIAPGQHPGVDFYAQVLRGEIALTKGSPAETLERLQGQPPENAPDGLKLRRYHARAEAFAQLGQPLEGAREYAELDLAMTDPAGRVANQVALLKLLAGADAATLQRMKPRYGSLLGGWIDLSMALRTPRSGLAAAVNAWRERNASHPLLPESLAAYQKEAGAVGGGAPGGVVAVMLPQSGNLKDVAAALQDGIMAAYQQRPAANRPQLSFLNSDSDDVANLYQQAVQNGARMVIGPLDKQRVARLASASLTVPVLALNQLPPGTPVPPQFYQYALSPEDEAVQVAERAWADGHSRALVLGATGEWGERIYAAFRERWQALGGEVAEYKPYDVQQRDFSDTVRALLKLEDSVDRRAEVQKLLGKKVAFEPQRRQDADFLFLIARADVARIVRPQLQFYYAGDLPVYATSHVYAGAPDAQRDQDLEGITFPDLPWILDPQAGGELAQQSVGQLFTGGTSVERRLYAMGMDSFTLLSELSRLESSPTQEVAGLTGGLSMDAEHKIHRHLAWAQFRQGVPQLLGATAAAPPAAVPTPTAPVQQGYRSFGTSSTGGGQFPSAPMGAPRPSGSPAAQPTYRYPAGSAVR